MAILGVVKSIDIPGIAIFGVSKVIGFTKNYFSFPFFDELVFKECILCC